MTGANKAVILEENIVKIIREWKRKNFFKREFSSQEDNIYFQIEIF